MDTVSAVSALWLVGPGAGAFLALAGALTISSVAVLNKGAKVNASWGLSAVGLTLIGVAEGSVLFERLGFPHLGVWAEALLAVGLAVILSGLVYARWLFTRLLK